MRRLLAFAVSVAAVALLLAPPWPSAAQTVLNFFEQADSTGDNVLNLNGTWEIGDVAVTSTAAELNALDGITATVSELNILDGVTATAAELNAVADVSGRLVSVTTTPITITAAVHADRTIVLNKADGVTLTLPAAAGTGNRYRVVVGTAMSGASAVVQVADATDIMDGVAFVTQDSADTALIFDTAADSDTVTFNATTQGGRAGDFIELEDIATNLWAVKVVSEGSGSEVTPFSAGVS